MNELRKGLIVLIGVSALAMSACTSNPKDDKAAAAAGKAGGQEQDIEIVVEDAGQEGIVVSSDVNGGQSNQNIIYFDYDSANIRDEYKTILQGHADFLLANPKAAVVIEGHADERGTREYNLALGENRAFKVKQFLSLKGVQTSQIRTVSFGEEKPEVEAHDEASWSKNRRAVFVYADN
ncbi:MAG: peptidoglycan-associated lipoprotein Pal [Gammaproteobacteria bacterium]|nr:peptidoglycan-associated lipoprotein Pal [Gammaproteobacteria bacterium]MDH5691750.1 peptidoglycan-associated lipoprotein Pal [Gammaproteobacteria bacterium]